MITTRPLDQQGWVDLLHHVPILEVADTEGITMYEDDTLIGAVVMDNWTECSVQCHWYVGDPKAVRNGLITTCLDYMFNERGMEIAYGFIPSDNERSLGLSRHIGCTEIARLKGGFKTGVDYVIMELLKENCRYLTVQEEVA